MLDEERQRLLRFLRATDGLLNRMVTEFADQWFPEELVPMIVGAWQQVRGNLEEAWSEVETGAHDDDLEIVGLTGASLNLKLAGFRLAVAAFEQDTRPRRFRWVLKWLNIILGSMGSVIPGIDAVKEFKEASEASLREDDYDG